MYLILVVDDDTAFRATLAETLEDLGYRVRQAASAEAGLRALGEGGIAAAIVDLRLPGDDGLALLRAAPAIAPDVPCIMLTAYASGANTIEAMRLGAFDHLTKPIGRSALAATLERALRAKAAAAPGPAEVAADPADTMVSSSEAMRAIFKRIGLVADELTRSCLHHECTVIDLAPSNFGVLLKRERPDLVFVESAWDGLHNAWKYQIASYPSHPQRSNASLRQLVAHARDLGIPTVFWNKEDGVHFDRLRFR